MTGNLGYVGSVLTAQMRREYSDWSLIGLDSGLFAHCLMPGVPSPDVNLNFQIFKDLRDINSDDLTGINAVVHLGAVSNDPIGREFEAVTNATNIDALTRIGSLAKLAGVSKFIFASSCSVYGKNDDGACSENAEVAPLTTYAKSKIEAERFLSRISSPSFQVISLRFATACGFSPRWRTDLVLNEFVADAVESGRLEVLSDGSPWRPLIHVRDMSRAILWAIAHRLAEQQPYLAVNIGSKEWNLQVRDLAEAVRDSVSGSEIRWNEDGKPDPRSYRVDFSLFEQIAPNHQPRVSLRNAINEMVAGLTSSVNLDHLMFNTRRLNEVRKLIDEGLISRDLRWTGKAARGDV